MSPSADDERKQIVRLILATVENCEATANTAEHDGKVGEAIATALLAGALEELAKQIGAGAHWLAQDPSTGARP